MLPNFELRFFNREIVDYYDTGRIVKILRYRTRESIFGIGNRAWGEWSEWADVPVEDE